MAPRLHTLMTPWMNEGFFADVVVLVEGEDDRAVILGAAQMQGFDLESEGYSVIPCGGKNNLDRPVVIFRELGIPCYVIWDSDKDAHDAKPENNHRLLKLMERHDSIEDWPNYVGKDSACFETNLETMLKSEIGEDVFNKYLEEYRNEFGFKRNHALKSPIVITKILQSAQQENRTSHTITQIIEQIRMLKPRKIK